MKRFNKKGFVLVETLIVTVFVMTLFILVYQNVVPYIGEYEKMRNYDDVDSVYASNLLKRVIERYANFQKIDEHLASNTYKDITNCSDSNIYKSSDYCEKIKKSLDILEDDYIFITKYNIDDFRNEVKTNEFFDSGKLSSFKDYLATVPSNDLFYDPDTDDLVGKYRLFVTRTVTNSDGSTTLKYVNLGIYTGGYDSYTAGDKIEFDPGDGVKRTFYVLKDSPSDQDVVTMILDQNIDSDAYTSVSGNNISNPALAANLITKLNTATKNWTNAINNYKSNYYDMYSSVNSYDYHFASDGSWYVASYTNMYARLLEAEDIYVLSVDINKSQQFSYNSMFSIDLDDKMNKILGVNLTGDNGYWMVNPVVNIPNMAWAVKNGKIVAINALDNVMGIRPVINVKKDKLK